MHVSEKGSQGAHGILGVHRAKASGLSAYKVNYAQCVQGREIDVIVGESVPKEMQHCVPVILDGTGSESTITLQVRTETIHYPFCFCPATCRWWRDQTLRNEDVKELAERLRIAFLYSAIASQIPLCMRGSGSVDGDMVLLEPTAEMMNRAESHSNGQTGISLPHKFIHKLLGTAS
jgi:hypothetical protein